MESVGGSATSMSFSAVADVFPVEPTVVLVGVEKKDIKDIGEAERLCVVQEQVLCL